MKNLKPAVLKIKKFWKRILVVLFIVPLLAGGGLIYYVQNSQTEIIKREVEKLNTDYKGLVRVGDSALSLFGNFPTIGLISHEIKCYYQFVTSHS